MPRVISSYRSLIPYLTRAPAFAPTLADALPANTMFAVCLFFSVDLGKLVSDF